MGTSDNNDAKSGEGQKHQGNRNQGQDTPKKGQGKNEGKSYEKFKGDEPALSGKIYYIGDYNQADSYTTTNRRDTYHSGNGEIFCETDESMYVRMLSRISMNGYR